MTLLKCRQVKVLAGAGDTADHLRSVQDANNGKAKLGNMA